MKVIKKGYELAMKTGRACAATMNKLKHFIENGDELQAYQTALGAVKWLRENNIPHDYKDIETRAHGIDKRWHENGVLSYERTYTDGKAQGIAKWWDSEGQEI